MSAAAEARAGTSDIAFLVAAHRLPLYGRLSASMRIGKYSGESQEDYIRRRDRVIKRRVQQWKGEFRYGHRMLSIVGNQQGICGDPSKDKTGKGCGCDLYALLPHTVHLDHIFPKSKGGGDELSNIQALCHTCNTSAGSKYPAVDAQTT